MNKMVSISDSTEWLRRVTIVMLLAAGVVVLLIAGGVFDPRPIGDEQWNRPLASMRIAAGSRKLSWLDVASPDQPFSLRLEAAHLAGELDSGYGLLLGDDNNYLAVGLSPVGYVTIWQARDSALGKAEQSVLVYLPWKPWPHIRTDHAENEIWIDVIANNHDKMEVTVRINRELLWKGEVEYLPPHIGIVVESFGDEAEIAFRSIRLYSD